MPVAGVLHIFKYVSGGKVCVFCGGSMKLQAISSTVFDRIMSSLAAVGAVILVLLMLLISTAVTTRYFFHQPIPGVIEIAEYSLLFIPLLAAAWVLKGEGHVKMDLILSRLTAGSQVRMNVVTSIICVLICLVLTWYGVKVTWEHFQIGHYQATTLRTPTFLILAIIPLGFFLLSIQFMRRTYGFWQGREH